MGEPPFLRLFRVSPSAPGAAFIEELARSALNSGRRHEVFLRNSFQITLNHPIQSRDLCFGCRTKLVHHNFWLLSLDQVMNLDPAFLAASSFSIEKAIAGSLGFGCVCEQLNVRCAGRSLKIDNSPARPDKVDYPYK